MVARVLKNRLRELMRQVRSASEEDMRLVIVTFFYRLLHEESFWQPGAQAECEIKSALKERFPSCFYSDEVRHLQTPLNVKQSTQIGFVLQERGDWTIRAHIHLVAVFGRVTRLLGLRFTELFEARLWRWVETDCEGTVGSIDDVKQALISISPTVRSYPS